MGVVMLTGASGAGKTTIARAFARRFGNEIAVHHFDSIGVPPVERMIEDHGSPEGWQRAKTWEWIARLAKAEGNVLFEGQVRIAFLAEAATARLSDYRVVLVDCDDDTRGQRLSGERGQPELANPVTYEWARYLRAEAMRGRHPILDTSRLGLDRSVELVRTYFST